MLPAARELVRHDILVMTIASGIMKTPIFDVAGHFWKKCKMH